MSRPFHVCLFIPCLNEADVLGETLSNIRRFFGEGDLDANYTIVVLDDGSTDGTAEVARNFGADYVYRHATNRGLGAATRAGMEIAHSLGCDAFVKFDADLQHDLDDVAPAVQLLLNDHADVVYASRFQGKIHYKMPLIRRWGNRTFTALMRFMTRWPVTDAQTGMMCFNRRYLAIFEMPSTYNPPQQALLDASHKGMRYAETPAQFRARTTGTSFVSLKYIPKVLSSLMKLSYYYYGFRAFAALSAFMFLVAAAAVAWGLVEYFSGEVDVYLPHGSVVLGSAVVGALALLMGLQSFALLGRQTHIRNGGRYLYIDLEQIERVHAAGVVGTGDAPADVGGSGGNTDTDD